MIRARYFQMKGRSKVKTISLTSLLLVLGLAVTAPLQGQLKRPPLPNPYHSSSSRNRPEVVNRPDGAELKLPQGFKIQTYSEGFQKPRFMVEGPSHEILISDSIRDGAVYVLLDKDGDFRAETKTTLIDGLNRPYGLAFWNDYLYIAETTSLKRYKYDTHSMTVSTPGEEVVSMQDFDRGHWTRTVLFDREGEKMYLTIGSASNVSTGEDPRRASIQRFNPDGSNPEIFASGLRNSVGLRWYPGTETLWVTVEERDQLGDDLVPDYFTSVRPGGFYGWPYAYLGPNEDPRNQGLRPDLVQQTLTPDIFLGAHVAVLDLIFYNGKQFPEKYHGGAFLAFHGSWNRAKRTGYSVMFVPFREGKPLTGPQDFLTGFMLDPDNTEVWGRPVGLFEMQDGSILVSEDGGNKIWRIYYD